MLLVICICSQDKDDENPVHLVVEGEFVFVNITLLL